MPVPTHMDWKVLTQILKVAKPTPDFATKLFMSNVQYSPVPKVTLRNVDATVSAAPLRQLYSSPTSANLQFAFDETSVTPPQIFEKQSVTEELLLSQITDPSAVLATQQSVKLNKEFVFAEAVERLKKRVLNRIELMCGQILSEGKINYNDGTFAYTVNYVTPNQLTLTANDNVVLILKQLVQAMKEKGFAPDYIIVSPDVEEFLWDNKYFVKAVEKASLSVGQAQLENQPYVSPVARITGLPDVVTYSAQIGTERTFDATGKIVIVSKSALGIAFGAVVNSYLSDDMTPKMGDMFAFQMPSTDGTSIDVAVISRPLPYVIGKDGLAIYDVTIS